MLITPIGKAVCKDIVNKVDLHEILSFLEKKNNNIDLLKFIGNVLLQKALIHKLQHDSQIFLHILLVFLIFA